MLVVVFVVRVQLPSVVLVCDEWTIDVGCDRLNLLETPLAITRADATDFADSANAVLDETLQTKSCA